jgi:ubiquinone/menaquinone biosynthesis C-methylase UbiE
MTQDTTIAAETIAERVRERYARAALQVQAGERSCCATECCSSAGDDPVTRDLYAAEQTAGVPDEAVLASLGCGNPTALIDLQPGQTVLDLGSGGGIDVLLSAQRVGPSGFVYGLDMTDEMLALAMANKEKAGATNVAFLKGRIEAIPLPADSVDVVISNCVINLAADKGQVLHEAFRVLKPAGRFAVSDVVADGPVPAALRRDMEAWVGCLAGALEIEEYKRLLVAAGFEDVSVEITRRYTAAQAGLDPASLPADWESGDGKLASAFVRATKPAAQHTQNAVSAATDGACCSSACCG